MGPKTDPSNKQELRFDDLFAEINDLSEDIKETEHLSHLIANNPSQINLFKARLSRLDSTYEKFRKTANEAISLGQSLSYVDQIETLKVLKKDCRELFYKTLSVEIKELKSDSHSTFLNQSMMEPACHSLKLPSINLPTFNGEVSEWVSYRDTFISLIHENSDLAEIQKFHYLKSSLKGQAAQSISAIAISAASYAQAWESSCKRYDNKRQQASNYLAKIFNFKAIQKINLHNLEQFSEIVLESAVAFKLLNLSDPAGFILYTYALRLVDPRTRERFEAECAGRTDIPVFDFFAEFIHRQFLQLQATNLNVNPIQQSYTTPNLHKTSKQVVLTTKEDTSNSCPLCHQRHLIYRCKQFLRLNPTERFKEVRAHSLCANCLVSSHSSLSCKSVNSCRICGRRHNSLLHFNKNKSDFGTSPKTAPKPQINSPEPPNSANTVLSSATIGTLSVLLGTAVARIQDCAGNYRQIRIIIDSGAQRSFITNKCAKQLGLPRSHNPHTLKGFANSTISGGKYQTHCLLIPRDKCHPQLTTNAVIIQNITDLMPSNIVPMAVKQYFAHFELADPNFASPGSIDFLLGADLFAQILKGESLATPEGIPNALKTVFGWVILGPFSTSTPDENSKISTLMSVSSEMEPLPLNNIMQKFWEVEEVASIQHKNPTDSQCEQHFTETHSRDTDGRYIVRLPFKDGTVELGDSYQMALHRLHRLEGKLGRNPTIKQEYSTVLQEHLQQNYISPTEERGNYFLPHHGVIKEGSTTSLRIVFDGSAKTINGSLNDKLLTGPKLQLNITDVLLKFRLFPIALIADIHQMYVQILVHPDDRLFQHFLYRFDIKDSLQEYEINRVTFGLSCSPFLALRVIRQLVLDEGATYPLASRALTENIYIDDILTGADTAEQASKLKMELVTLLQKGGFKLKKWASNSKDLLQNIESSKDDQTVSLSNLEEPSIKILGIQWNSLEDVLSYKIQTLKYTPTKRGIMSAIARMYDPLGYLSPVTFKAKTILQALWKNKYDWDEKINNSIAGEWKSLFDTLTDLWTIQIPRYIMPNGNHEITVVGFADASSLRYAAVIYVRIKNQEGVIKNHLLFSKTRLAPLKTSIPRLELCASVLLVKTMEALQKFFDCLHIKNIYLLTDSTIVLSWLNTQPYKLKTFVANRIVKILESSSILKIGFTWNRRRMRQILLLEEHHLLFWPNLSFGGLDFLGCARNRRWDSFSVEQTTEICTFFPDHLIDLICSEKPYTSFTGYVIFADVSGFTALCEKYATFGHSGAYHLTVTLNNYIGKMVSLIYSHGGDLIKFAGDAFLAVWESNYSEEIFVGMHKIVRCAMEIQNSLGHYQTDVGILLRVKLSISLGSFLFATIGSKQNASYILYGLPILEVKEGEKLCSSGDTVLSPAAWSLLDPMNYVYEVVKSDYVKVREILYDPMKFRLPSRQIKKNRIPLLLKPWKLKERYFEILREEMSHRGSMRPNILKTKLKEHADVLRRFVITPVVHQIQKGSSVEYLIEMRQVTILFLNIVPKDLAATKITLLANEVHRTVTKIIERKLGLINKICLFDKDIMLLILFGLKGYKGKDEALRTLQCGATIIDHVSQFINVKSVSVGVTVGTTYCGVVGHPQRREYTVIGGAVNRAARLMVAFKNVVSCDLTVVFNSRLPIGYFERTKPVYLKGIGIVGNIFIYVGPGGNTIKTPLLGRYNIVCKFVDMMAKTTPYQCLILRGDPRIGKSRILQEFLDVSEHWGWNSLMVAVNQMNTTDLCLVNKLISSFIGKTIKDRMRVLLDAASEEELDHLHLLNKLFDVKFSVPHDYDKLLISEDRQEFYKRMLRKIFTHSVIVIDDAEDLDSESWRALCMLIRIPEIIVVFAIPSSYDLQNMYAKQLISDPLSLTINIECLPAKYIGPLICQMLSADAVPYKLIKLLEKISHGNAGWIQTFLLSYVDSGAIIVMSEPSHQINRNLYMIPDPSLVRTEFGNPFRTSNLPKDLQVCQLMNKSVDVNKVPPTFDDVIMATFDKLTPFEQLLLKCGAILGKDFKRYALVYMMEFPSESALCEAVEVLFKMDILGCANVKNKQEFDENILSAPIPVAECNCDTVPLTRLSFPKYAFCEFLSFKFSILASTIYQTIPVNQRIQFHTRALYSIKEQVMKCNECVHREILISIENRMGTSNELHSSESDIADIKVTLEQLRRTDPYKEFKRKKNLSIRRAAIVSLDEKMSINKVTLGRRHGVPNTQFKLDLDALKEMAERRQESLNVKVRRVNYKSISRSFLKDIFYPTVEEENEDSFQMYIGDILNIVRISDSLRASRRKKRRYLNDIQYFKPNVNCSCYSVGIDIYRKLIYHSRSAELKITELKYLVECAVHHTKYSQFQSALKLLLEARNLYQTCLNLLLKSKAGTKLAEGNDTLTLKDLRFEKKKIHCYLGKCYLCLGDLPKCLHELNEVASESYLFVLEVLANKIFLNSAIFKRSFVEKRRTEIALSSFVYIVLSDLYLMMFLFREAAYTARIAIRYALVLKKLQFMANAYAACIDAYLMIGKLESSKKTEKEALDICLEVYSEKSNWDLLSLGKVYLAIFKGRVSRGEMVKAIEIGEALLNIAETFKALDVLAYVYPAMLLILGYLHKLEKVKELLLKLKVKKGDVQSENDLREHLHIRMNMYLLVEVGYCMIPPNLLINQIRKSINPNLIPVDRIICRRVAIYMWVWYLRRNDIANAQIWEVVPYDNVDLCYENIPSTLIMLQGKLMYMSHIIQAGGTVSLMLLDEIKTRIKKLERICKERIPIFLARIYHLKAYKQILFASILNKFTAGFIPGLSEITSAVKYAKRCGNNHQITWIAHSLNNWYALGYTKLAGEVHRKNHYNYEIVEKDSIVKYEHDDILYDLPLPRKTKRRLKNIILLTDYNYGNLSNRLWRITVGIFRKNQDRSSTIRI